MTRSGDSRGRIRGVFCGLGRVWVDFSGFVFGFDEVLFGWYWVGAMEFRRVGSGGGRFWERVVGSF